MNETVLDCLDIVSSNKEGGADFCNITVDEIIERKPNLSFILGRSCVGKSTLAKQLSDKGFNIIHLDELIKEINLIKHIKEIYANSVSEEILNKVLGAITNKVKYPTVIEGAIKNMALIEKIVSNVSAKNKPDSLYIVYVSPEKGETVERNMIERFKLQLEGLSDNPLPVQMTPELIEDFKKNGMKGELVKAEMKRFADETMDISSHRKELFASTSGGNKIYVLPSESISPPMSGGTSLVPIDEKKGAGCGCGVEITVPSDIEQTTDILTMLEREELNEVREQLPLSGESKYSENKFDLGSVIEEAPTNVKIMNLTEMIEESKAESQNKDEQPGILFALESPKKKVKFANEELSQGSHYQKEKKTKKIKKHKTSRVTIGGLEYDATGYGVYEVQQRRFRAQHDGGFDPLELYEGQSYTDGGDIALKMIKKSKINELVTKVIGGLSDAISEYERSSHGGNSFDNYLVLAITAKEVKQSDIDDLDYLKSKLSNLVEEVDQSLPNLDVRSGGKTKYSVQLTQNGIPKMKRLKINKNDECRKKILELEKKTESVIRKLEKKITEDINFIESITLLLKSKTENIKAQNGGNEENEQS